METRSTYIACYHGGHADEEEGDDEEEEGDEGLIDNNTLAEAFMLYKGREDVLAKVGSHMLTIAQGCFYSCAQ